MHYSNVQLVDPQTHAPVRVRWRYTMDGQLVRGSDWVMAFCMRATGCELVVAASDGLACCWWNRTRGQKPAPPLFPDSNRSGNFAVAWLPASSCPSRALCGAGQRCPPTAPWTRPRLSRLRPPTRPAPSPPSLTSFPSCNRPRASSGISASGSAARLDAGLRPSPPSSSESDCWWSPCFTHLGILTMDNTPCSQKL